jgi:hypothetical protein
METAATSEGHHKPAGRKLNVVLWIKVGLLAAFVAYTRSRLAPLGQSARATVQAASPR